MSTAPRRTLARAQHDADAFTALLIPARACERFEIAGSIRRRKPDIGDVDIVAIPRFEEIPSADMFATPVLTNLLWHRVDDLLAAGEIKKHERDTEAGLRTCWGDKLRSVEFRGCAYDINLADKDNWGPMLAIKTGPAELSKAIVTNLPRYGYACRDGFHVWDLKCSPGPRMLPELTEEMFFGMAGIPFKEPEKR